MPSFISVAVALMALHAFGKPAAPVGLLVNGVNNPLAIDREEARFTWRSVDTGRRDMQAAYQILVATSAEGIEAGKGDWWDSGKVDSDQSAGVEYAGKALPTAKRFFWKVRVWSQTGKSSEYSAPAFFDTGLNQNEWTANFIWDGTTNQNNFAYFRKAFVVQRKPSLAKVFVTAHNDYLLYLNGQQLGRGPARSDPYVYGQYNAYDITKLLKTGSNVFAAIGHWQGTWFDSGVNAKPAFMLEARLDYPDGSSSTIGTDQSWKVLANTGFIETDPTYFILRFRNRAAIQFDSRREPAGWREVGFDDSKWASATVVDRSDYHLFAQMAPVEREQAEIEPVSVASADGAWLVDFGRCIDGWPKLTMRANHSGDVVRVEYFEMTGQRKPSGWDEYICHGGRETWDADFGRHTTFQVLKITGYAGKLKASHVRGMWAYCDADVAGRFRCSNPLLNDIYEMCERSARQNVQQGIISVDANREQSPWLADSWNIGNVLLYNDRDTTMIDKIVRDYAAEQMPNGNFRACSPANTFQCAEWSMYWPMLLWQQYLFSGDQTLLRTMSPRLTHFMAWLKKYQDPTTKLVNPPGTGRLTSGDRISDYAGGNMPKGYFNAATACQYYEDLRVASHIFSVLGQTKQSEEYARQAEEVKAGINSHLFNGQYYLARIDRKEMFSLASAWALRFDIVPKEIKSEVIDVIEKGGKPNVGGYGGDAFYSGMFNAGAGDFVVRDLARYRPMLDENKANWESWQVNNGEVNHAWTSYPGYLFLKFIVGIQPTSGGFATFDVRPEIGGLTFAEGTVPTVKGLVTTRWKKNADGQFSLSINVPANTRATIYIPRISEGNFIINESGKILWPAKSDANDSSVLAVSAMDSSIKCVVDAGTYHFHEVPQNP
jgi:alpha-L-rhamnosidase